MKNIKIQKTTNLDYRLIYDRFALGPGPNGHNDRTVFDINVKVLGINEGKTAVAFTDIDLNANEKVYLLNDIYEPFKDELEGWGVIPLNGDLNKLK